jgi:predicted ATP-grasp superfamily ATP-dependent carboligase
MLVSPRPEVAPRARAGMTSAPSDVLLTNGGFYGTLAAARYFGRHGHRVVIADPETGSPAAASRYVSAKVICPSCLDGEALIDWLVAYGRRHPGTLLYPCSDDHAWLYARHHARLAPHFITYQPAFEVIQTLLDKERLYRTCVGLGIPVPDTRYPRSMEDVAAMARTLDTPYLVKPKSQVGLTVAKKAVIAGVGEALVEAYADFRSRFSYSADVQAHAPSLTWPMLQAFQPSAATQTISVAGFSGCTERSFHAVASRKALQYPINIGIGLCFESLAPQEVLFERVRRICASVGYFGVFEVEFIQVGDEYLLMDFNPRFYGQMQLEISRGVPLPGLVAAMATGTTLEVDVDPRDGWYLGNRSLLRFLATTQWLGGRMTRAQRREWLTTGIGPGRRWVDQVDDPDDRRPWWTDTIARYRSYVNHPRSSWRKLFGDA